MSHPVEFMILSEDNISAYLDDRPQLGNRVGTVIQVEMPEDGNINGVYIVRGDRGSLVLKQGLPWVRIIETWELTAERTTREANLFEKWSPFAEGLLPAIFDFDEENHVIAMEDLSRFTLLADAFGQAGGQQANIERIGRLLARAFLGTSPFFLDPAEYSTRLIEAENPELAELMEQVVFDQPWESEPLDYCHRELQNDFRTMLDDPSLQARVGDLKFIFRTVHEGLIHGDLHTGSVMVTEEDLRVFDAEFARYGPVAWDVGEFIGHLRIAAVALEFVGDGAAATVCEPLPAHFWNAFEQEVRSGWGERNDETFTDSFLDEWLSGQSELAARFAGVEIARRMTGVGKANPIEALPEDRMLEASRKLLGEARQLISTGSPTWT